MTHRRWSAWARWLAVAVFVVGATACGADDAEPDGGVTAAWTRPIGADATDAAVYFTITSETDDVLVSATVSPDVAADAGLFAVEAGEASGGAHDHGGGDDAVAEAEEQEFDVVAGEALRFEPGGNHVMLFDVVGPLAEGDHFELTLEFADGPDIATEVEVASNPPSD